MISVCMMVRNEERYLPRCLDSVRPVADELIVVDTGSTDSTLEICCAYGAKVIAFEFSRIDFAAARNASLERAQGKWILVLDADETLEQSCLPALRELVEKGEPCGYFLERLNYSSDSTEIRRDYVVRLFPNRAAHRYRHRVHETIDKAILAQGGQLVRTRIQIHHIFADSIESRRRRNLQYVQILKEEIAADPSDLTRLDFLAAEYHQLEMYVEAAAVLEQLTLLRPHDPQTHLFAGAYHLLFKPDLPQARLDLLRALALKPDYPEAQAFLHSLSEQEGIRACLS